MEEEVFQSNDGWYFELAGLLYGPYNSKEDALEVLSELQKIPFLNMNFSSFVKANKDDNTYQVFFDSELVGSTKSLNEISVIYTIALFQKILKKRLQDEEREYWKMIFENILKNLNKSLAEFQPPEEEQTSLVPDH